MSVQRLPASEMTMIRQVAGFTTLTELANFIESLPELSKLWQHCKDVRFTSKLATSAAAVALPTPAAATTAPTPARISPEHAQARPKAKANAKAKAKGESNPQIPAAIYRFVRRASASGRSTKGHDYRMKHGIHPRHPSFESHKYGVMRRRARCAHDANYDAKRVRRKPAAH